MLIATLFVGAALTSCTKTKPVSTTTTHSDTTTETENGDKKSIHTTEVNTQQPDGSETKSSTIKTDSTSPPPPVVPSK